MNSTPLLSYKTPSRVVKPVPASGGGGSDVSLLSGAVSVVDGAGVVGSELVTLGVVAGGGGTGTGLGLLGTVAVGIAGGGGAGVVPGVLGLVVGATVGTDGVTCGVVPTGGVDGDDGVTLGLVVVTAGGVVSVIALGSPEPHAVNAVVSSAGAMRAARPAQVVLVEEIARIEEKRGNDMSVFGA